MCVPLGNNQINSLENAICIVKLLLGNDIDAFALDNPARIPECRWRGARKGEDKEAGNGEASDAEHEGIDCPPHRTALVEPQIKDQQAQLNE